MVCVLRTVWEQSRRLRGRVAGIKEIEEQLRAQEVGRLAIVPMLCTALTQELRQTLNEGLLVDRNERIAGHRRTGTERIGGGLRRYVSRAG